MVFFSKTATDAWHVSYLPYSWVFLESHFRNSPMLTGMPVICCRSKTLDKLNYDTKLPRDVNGVKTSKRWAILAFWASTVTSQVWRFSVCVAVIHQALWDRCIFGLLHFFRHFCAIFATIFTNQTALETIGEAMWLLVTSTSRYDSSDEPPWPPLQRSALKRYLFN